MINLRPRTQYTHFLLGEAGQSACDPSMLWVMDGVLCTCFSWCGIIASMLSKWLSWAYDHRRCRNVLQDCWSELGFAWLSQSISPSRPEFNISTTIIFMAMTFCTGLIWYKMDELQWLWWLPDFLYSKRPHHAKCLSNYGLRPNTSICKSHHPHLLCAY